MSTQEVDQDPVIAYLMNQARSAVNEIESAAAAACSPSITDGRLLIQTFRTLEDLLTEGWRLPREWQSTETCHLSADQVGKLLNEMHAAGAAATAAAVIDPDDADLNRVANAFVALDEALSAGGPIPLKWVIGADDI